MSRSIFMACGALVVAGLAASAQTPQPPNPPSPTPPQPPATAQPSASADAGRTMTLTGCVKAWDGKMGSAGSSTTPGSSAGAAATEYILTNIGEGTAPSSASTTKPDMPPATSAKRLDMAHNTYLLKAQDPGVNLALHVNHKVEVIGTVSELGLMEKHGATPSVTSPSGQPHAEDAMRDMMKPRALNVTALKMVAAVCP